MTSTPSGPGLDIARVVGWTVLLVMVGALVYASVRGDFWSEGGTLLALPWGQVTLIETYIGYALLGAWIVQRENQGWKSALWILAMCSLGHLVSGIYILRAAAGAQGRRDRFWLGQR